MTGALNPCFFIELLQMEIEPSRRYEHPFTIAYIDIDQIFHLHRPIGRMVRWNGWRKEIPGGVNCA